MMCLYIFQLTSITIIIYAFICRQPWDIHIITAGSELSSNWASETINVAYLHDPTCKHLRWHPGTNADIFRGVVEHELFPDFLATAKHMLSNHPVRLFVQCRAGKHRSIACAIALKFLLENDGIRVKLSHWAEWTAGRDCLIGECDRCTAAGRAYSLQKALWLWRTIP